VVLEMPYCQDCNKDMRTGSSCVPLKLHYKNKTISRIRYGQEKSDWGAKSGMNCGDCNVKPGGYHHYGCDVQRCPIDGRQLMSCGHLVNATEIKRNGNLELDLDGSTIKKPRSVTKRKTKKKKSLLDDPFGDLF